MVMNIDMCCTRMESVVDPNQGVWIHQSFTVVYSSITSLIPHRVAFKLEASSRTSHQLNEKGVVEAPGTERSDSHYQP